MIKRHVLIVSAMLICSLAIGQDFHYEPLKVSGPIPEDFTLGYIEKLEAKKSDINPNLNRKKRKEELSFHEYNEFVLDIHLTSGKVMYGDDVSIYLGEVLDKVLEHDKSLRNEIRIYAVRSASFNAYTTNNGIILVNMGLLAELETEAQLAYVLSHEVVHYMENHVQKSFNYRNELAKSRNSWNYDSEKIAKQYYAYSKEHELEADEQGYKEFFKKTGYNSLAPFELMDIMLYSYLPFDEIPFDANIFKTANYGIEDASLLEYPAKEISAREDVSDSLSTHPNIKARTEALGDFLAMKDEGQNFIVSEERFKALRNQARFESLDYYLQTGDYDRAIYQAFLLGQNNDNDAYLKRAIAYAAYASSVYKNYYRLPGDVKDMENVEGELSRVRFILNRIDAEELNTLAVALAYENYKNNPDDKLSKRIFKDAVWEITHYHEKTLDDYKEAPVVNPADSALSNEQEEGEVELHTSRKVKRLKQTKTKKSTTQYAFSAYLADTLFTNEFARQEEDMEDYLDNLPRLASKSNKKGKKLSLKQVRDTSDLDYGHYFVYPDKKENLGGKGIKKVMIITPENYTLSSGKRVNYNKSSRREHEYVSAIKNAAKLNHIKYELFDYKYIDEIDSEAFNEMQMLQLWYDEKGYHRNIGIVNYMYDRVKPISEKYETDYLLYTGMLNINTAGMTKGIGNLYGGWILGAAFPPMIPFMLGAAYAPTYSTFQFIQVYDMENDKSIMRRSNEFKHYRTNAVTENMLYQQLNELSTKPKYKN